MRQLDSRRPLVSVIMPTYNAARFVEETVRSIQAQSFQNWELICVDDCSSDNTWDILRRFASEDDRIRILRREVNGGPSAARNTALSAARGQFVAVQDADDPSLPHRLNASLRAFVSRPDLGLIAGHANVIDGMGTCLDHWAPPTQTDDEIRAYLPHEGNAFVHSTVMVRRELLEEVGGYDERVRGVEDYDLYLRLLPHCRFGVVPATLAMYRIHGVQESVTGRLRQRALADFVRARAAAMQSGKEFDEDGALRAVDRYLKKRMHWLPRDAAHLAFVGQVALRNGDVSAARRALVGALGLCPLAGRAMVWYLLSLCGTRISSWIAAVWLDRKKRQRERRDQQETGGSVAEGSGRRREGA